MPGGVVATRAQAIRGLRAFAAVDSISLTDRRVVRSGAAALTTHTVFRRNGDGRWLAVSRTLTPCNPRAAERGVC